MIAHAGQMRWRYPHESVAPRFDDCVMAFRQ
jgi:hypothetical protein